MNRPPYAFAAITGSFLVFVRLDPVKSAEPPMVLGSVALITSSAISEALRVATEGFSVAILFLSATSAGASAEGMSPDSAASNCFFSVLAPKRISQFLRREALRAPAVRQAERMSLGTSNGG